MGYRQPLPDKEITIDIVWTMKEYDQDNDDDDRGRQMVWADKNSIRTYYYEQRSEPSEKLSL